MLRPSHVLPILVIVAAAGSAQAQDDLQVTRLRLSGFGTVGVLHSNAPAGWGFRRDFIQPLNDGGTRSDIDTRIGVQANYALTERVEAVTQLVGKKKLNGNLKSDTVEWAFLAYRPTKDLAIRVGRVSPGIYMLSDVRNVGFAYPWIRPNVEFYGALPLYAMDGVDVARTWDFGDVRWKVTALASNRAHANVETPGQGTTRIDVRKLFGASLSREEDGLTVRAQIASARLVPQKSAAVQQVLQGLSALQAFPLPAVAAEAARLGRDLSVEPAHLRFFSLGADFNRGHWLATVEGARVDGNIAAFVGYYGYASVGRRLGDFTVFGMVGVARTAADPSPLPQWEGALAPVIGPAAAAQLQQLGTGVAMAVNRQRIDQSSLSVGMRWDLNAQTALKLQWDHYRIKANGSQLWANGGAEAGSANVVGMAIDFVF